MAFPKGYDAVRPDSADTADIELGKLTEIRSSENTDCDTEEELGRLHTLKVSSTFWKKNKVVILCTITWISSFTTNYIADIGRQYYQDEISTQTLTSYQQGFLFLFVVLQKSPSNDFKIFSKGTSTKLIGIGFFRMLAQFLGNAALLMFSLNFAIYTVVKASKILLLLLMGCFMLRVPSSNDVKIGFALFISLVLFQYPKENQPFKMGDLYGICLMFMTIGSNTFAQLSTEKILKNSLETVSGLDVMLYSQIIPVLMLVGDVLVNGMLPKFILAIVFLQALSNYVAVRTSLEITKIHSSFVVTILNVSRRIATVIFALFASEGPIGMKDTLGLGCFLIASYLIYQKKASN